MKDKLLDLYEILGAAWIMAFPGMYFLGMRDSMLLLLAGAAALYLVSSYKKLILWYLLTAGILIALVGWTEKELLSRVLTGIGAGVGIIGFFAGRIKGQYGLFTGISYWYLLPGAAGYALAMFQKWEPQKGRVCVFAAVLVLICLLKENQRAVNAYIKENEKLHRFPKKRVRAKNQGAVLVLCLLTAGAMMTGYLLTPDLNFRLKPIEVNLTPEPERAEEPMNMPMGNEWMGGEYREAPAWLKTLGEWFYNFTLVMILLAGIFLIVLFLYKMIKRYRNQFEKNTKAVSLDEEDQIEKVLPKGSGFRNFFQKKSPAELIRRYYKKWIQKALKVVPHTAAPAELEKQAELCDEELHVLYEKARYSTRTCTKEESTLAKQKVRG